MDAHKLSLLTYNIHKGFSMGNLRFFLPKMRQAIEALNPSIAFLQEVQGEHIKHAKKQTHWPSLSQFEYMAEKLWPHYAYGKNAIYQAGHHGNAILSQYAFEQYENINVSTMKRASRSLLHASVIINQKEVHLVCVHLGLFKAERIEQMKKLAQRINDHVPHDSPLLLAGDFNDWRRECFDVIEGELGLKEAIKELTGEHARSFPAISPMLHTDRIYYRGMTLLDAEVLKGAPWRTLSDHLPLFAEFEL